ncbi:hypothetical protein CONCODRAFT_80312, partial [Conidiobolus coronatus NRRL 28638]
KQSDANIKSEKISSKTENFVTESKPSKKSKLNDLHYKCLRKYLKEDILIGYTEAMEKLQEETDIKCSYSAIRKAIIKLREEINTNSTNLDPSAVKDRSFNGRTKLKDLHIEYLKKYLRENIHIGNTEAMNRLYQDTGLKISVTPVRLTLIKLEEEIRGESESKACIESRNQVGKIKKIHVELLKKYLSENASIGYYKAKTKLKQDTGLDVTAYEVQKSLFDLKNSTNQDNIENQLNSLKVRCRRKAFGFKIKGLHIEYLKKYLKDDNSIGTSDARDQLYKDTGLEVTIPAIHTTLAELKEQNNYLKDSYLSPTSDSKNMNITWSYGRKLKDNHIECLKKYLKEDISIGSTKAKNKLYEETGLEISISPVQKALIKLKKDLCQESSNLFPKSGYKAENKTRDYNYTLKGHHIELFKSYLKEDNFIGNKEARIRLKEETGFDTTASTVSVTMTKLRKEMGLKNIDLRPHAAKKASINRLKLKDLHLEYLRKYLNEDNLIGPTEAMKKLQKETGLKCSPGTIQKKLANLREEMGLECVNLTSVSAKRIANTRSKLKDSHLELLKKNLIEDALIGPTEARNRLKEDTGLTCSLPVVCNTLKKLRKELNLDYTNLDPSAVKNRRLSNRSKLKDSHLKLLKNILKEDALIGTTEARNRLKEEFSLETSYYIARNALIKMKKELAT